MVVIKKILKILLEFLFFSTLVVAVLYFFPILLNNNKIFDRYPNQNEPIKVKFSWFYKGKEHNLEEVFYHSVYNYYQTKPKKVVYLKNISKGDWENDYYGMFLELNEKEKTFADLASKLKSMGDKEGYDNDEMVEFFLAFVQSIPYDNVRAEAILKSKEEGPNYPYEALYENKGTCGEKSFLLYLLWRQLGYGVALFEYASSKHLAVGIRCDQDYSTYSSGYCYAETTTSGHPIGIFSEDNEESSFLLKSDWEEDRATSSLSVTLTKEKLGEHQVYRKVDGRIYSKIMDNIVSYKKLKSEKDKISSEKKRMEKEKAELKESFAKIEEKKSDLYKYRSIGDYNSYNYLVNSYNEAVANYKRREAGYNSQIENLNRNIAGYNQMKIELYQINYK